jgi:hypothetical protein
MGFFIFQWVISILGLGIHYRLDRADGRRTRRRFFELSSLWFLVSAGAFAIWGGIYHLGPTSHSIATQIGYAPSMFQWEVGFADIAIGILCILCVRASNRGQWMTAALTALTASFYGDGTGHLMQLIAHHNTAPENVWAIPTCFLIPILAVSFTALARQRSTTPEAQSYDHQADPANELASLQAAELTGVAADIHN